MFQELFKYGVAGAIGFAADFTVLYTATEWAGLHYLVSNVLAYSTGLLLTYILNTRWVFSHRRFDDNRGVEFGLFATIVLGGLLASELLMLTFVESGQLNYLHAKVASSLLVAAANYLAKKFFLFTPGTAHVEVNDMRVAQ